MVGPAGLEPATKGLWVPCSNQLSYGPYQAARWYTKRWNNALTLANKTFTLELENRFFRVRFYDGHRLPEISTHQQVIFLNKYYCGAIYKKKSLRFRSHSICKKRVVKPLNLNHDVLMWNLIRFITIFRFYGFDNFFMLSQWSRHSAMRLQLKRRNDRSRLHNARVSSVRKLFMQAK